MSLKCLPCSKETEINETHSLVKRMYRRLFEGNGDSLTTIVALHGEAIKDLEGRDKTSRNRFWEFAKLLIAAALPILILWASGKL